MESTDIGKVSECIQMVLGEVRHLLDEVQGLLSASVKDSDKLQAIIGLCQNLSEYLACDPILEHKDLLDIPRYYSSMMSEFELPSVKIEEKVNDSPDDTFNEELLFNDISDDEDEKLSKRKKRKTRTTVRNQIKSESSGLVKKGNKKLMKQRPMVKNVPPDMKIRLEEEAGICESRRRKYCPICTKGFGNQKRLDAHLAKEGECPGKPNPKWHYTNMEAKRMFCIHPDCFGPTGQFDINYLENSFNSGCISGNYFEHGNYLWPN